MDWYSISSDLLPFFAKNQFKEKKLSAMVDEINARESKPIKKQADYRMVRDMASRLDSLLAGEAIVPQAPKFLFKVLAHSLKLLAVGN